MRCFLVIAVLATVAQGFVGPSSRAMPRMNRAVSMKATVPERSVAPMLAAVPAALLAAPAFAQDSVLDQSTIDLAISIGRLDVGLKQLAPLLVLAPAVLWALIIIGPGLIKQFKALTKGESLNPDFNDGP